MASVVDAHDARLWDLLLQNIAQGSVVPIVGRDLLTLDPAPGGSLHASVAIRLAAALRVDPPAADDPGPLNAVASQYILTGGEVDDVYAAVDAILREMEPLPIPVPLRQLAAIDAFSLFVTTTFDDLLARAVKDVRGAEPCVLGFSTRAAIDDYRRGGPTVYHLFGRRSSLQEYVVTEEDALEFVFSLQSPRQPVELLHELSQRTLLIVGCSFPTWAVRFILRLSRGRRLLFADRDKIAFVVDPGANKDAGLLQFLRAFKTRTELFSSYQPAAFVSELSARWAAQSPAAGPNAVMPPGAIFVSYPSEDRERVEKIIAALRARNLAVWFDRDALSPGVGWQDTIERNIDQAAAFVPILSTGALAHTDRFFIAEWRRSLERNRRMAFDDRFLFPIAIDRVNPEDPAIPAEFRAVQWTVIDQEPPAVPDALVTALNDAIRRKILDTRR